jgi:hypothetical protein
MAFSIFDFSFHEGKYSYYTVRERDPQSRWQEEHPARYNLAKTIYWANYLSTLKLCPFGGFSAVVAAAAGLGYGTVAASITSAKLKIK